MSDVKLGKLTACLKRLKGLRKLEATCRNFAEFGNPEQVFTMPFALVHLTSLTKLVLCEKT